MSTSDEVDWGRLQHAYGSANDVPDQLKALASQERENRQEAIRQCYSNIYHQGTRYSASVAAIPILIDLLKDDSTPDRHEILSLILHLAVGFPHHLVSRGFVLSNLSGLRSRPGGTRASRARR